MMYVNVLVCIYKLTVTYTYIIYIRMHVYTFMHTSIHRVQ